MDLELESSYLTSSDLNFIIYKVIIITALLLKTIVESI